MFQVFFGKKKYYFNIKTFRVEEGKLSPWNERMGPYKTREDAQKALEIVKYRNEIADKEDEKWK